MPLLPRATPAANLRHSSRQTTLLLPPNCATPAAKLCCSYRQTAPLLSPNCAIPAAKLHYSRQSSRHRHTPPPRRNCHCHRRHHRPSLQAVTTLSERRLAPSANPAPRRPGNHYPINRLVTAETLSAPSSARGMMAAVTRRRRRRGERACPPGRPPSSHVLSCPRRNAVRVSRGRQIRIDRTTGTLTTAVDVLVFRLWHWLLMVN